MSEAKLPPENLEEKTGEPAQPELPVARFLAIWIAVLFVATVAGSALQRPLWQLFGRQDGSSLAFSIAMLSYGVLIDGAQWLLLRRRLALSGLAWIGVSLAVGLVLALLYDPYISLFSGKRAMLAWALFETGALAGAQSLLLKKLSPAWTAWLVANLIGAFLSRSFYALVVASSSLRFLLDLHAGQLLHVIAAGLGALAVISEAKAPIKKPVS